MGFGQTSLSGVRCGFMPSQLKTKTLPPLVIRETLSLIWSEVNNLLIFQNSSKHFSRCTILLHLVLITLLHFYLRKFSQSLRNTWYPNTTQKMLDSKRNGAEVELSKIERGVPITSRSYDETYRKTNQRNVCICKWHWHRPDLSAKWLLSDFTSHQRNWDKLRIAKCKLAFLV